MTPGPPFDRLNAARIRKVLASSFRESYTVDEARGLVSFPRKPVPFLNLVMSGLPKSRQEEAMDVIREGGIEATGELEHLISALDHCPAEAVHREEVVGCWVATGFGSGWCVNAYTSPERGYVVYHGTGDEALLEDRIKILGMWQPAGNDVARRECVTRCYARYWSDCCLPPQLGECARGSQPLWMECLLRMLREDPGLWPVIVQRMPFRESITAERWEYVRHVTGLSEERLLELYREAGFRLRLEKAPSGSRAGSRPSAAFEVIQEHPRHADYSHGLAVCEEAEEEEPELEMEEEEEEEDNLYNLIMTAAPFDEESAKFLLANFCYILEHTNSNDRETNMI